MRKEAKRRHPKSKVQWINDRLPDLGSVSRQEPFDLILLSAVWMHVAKSERKRAFRKIVNLLKPGGTLAVTLRHGPHDPERGFREVSVEGLEDLARDHGAVVAYQGESRDCQGRKGSRWSHVAIQFPDDDTGRLPLLRHIILQQSKSGTHKLGLLRTLCRIADGAPGTARANKDGSVSIPMGLVALTWLRLYKPLLGKEFPQLSVSRPGSLHLGFVKDAYREIESLSHLDLRMGMSFGEEQGPDLHRALWDAAKNIREMPIKHMTYPGAGQEPILEAVPCARTGKREEIRLDEDYLFSFGEVRVPETLWQALRKHALWVEPVVISEWAEMIRGYAHKQDRAIDENELRDAMVWADPVRDVRDSRVQAERLLENRELYCVWSGKRLKTAWDIDHCLPWSVWSCGDLWNLMPASRKVNQNKKRDLLPSESTMDAAHDCILHWWKQAYCQGSSLVKERFQVQAASSLPGIRSEERPFDLEEIFESVCLQRTKLRRDQRAPEWHGLDVDH